MLSTKENYFTIANKTSSSFYSISSLNKRRTTTHFSSTSSTFNQIKLKKKSCRLRNFHKSFLKDKFLSHNRTLSFGNLSNENTTNSNNQFFITKYNYNPKIKDILFDEIDDKQKFKTINHEYFLPIKTRKYNIYPKINARKESLLDFKYNILNAQKVKLVSKILEKVTTNILELKRNEIERIEMEMYQLKNTNELYYKYYYQLNQYCRFLSNQCEIEKLNLKKIFLQELSLKTTIKDYQGKILNYKKLMVEGENMINLLLCIKYHVLDVKDLPKEVIQIYHLEKFIPSLAIENKKNNQRRSFDKNITKKKSLIRAKRNSYVGNSHHIKTQQSKPIIQRRESQPIPLIYYSMKDFQNDYSRIQGNIMNLFLKYNQLTKDIANLREERKSLIEEKMEEIKKEKKKINELESMVLEGKRKNLILKNTYKSIINGKKDINLKKKIYPKVATLVKTIPYNVEVLYNSPNLYNALDLKAEFYSYKGNKYDTIKHCLFIVERFLMQNLYYINEKKLTFSGLAAYLQAKKRADIQKKIKNNVIKEQINKERIIERNNKIIKKLEKVYYLPKRKVEYIHQTTSNFKEESINKNIKKRNKSYTLKYDDVLYY